MMKKITAVIISVILVFNCMYTFSADDVQSTNEHGHSLEILNALRIVEEDAEAFDENDNITRAEFVQYVVRLLGITNPTATKEELTFSDIPYTYWATPYIVYASNMGLISGYTNGEFGPEDWLTYEQAVKVLLAAIGHTSQTTYFQSYPQSYVLLADNIGLLRNVDGSIGVEMKKGDAIEMIYNALECETVIQYLYGSTNKYGKNGTTMLEEYWNIRKIKGVFNANEYRNAYGESLPVEGMIEIDRVPFFTQVFPVDETLLFSAVEAYVRKDSDDREYLVYMERGKGRQLEISTEDIDAQSDRNTVCYYVDNNQKKVRVSENASVLMNGRYFKAAENLTSADLTMKSADLFMYDIDDNGSFDILNFKKYESFIVERIDSKNNTIFLKYDRKFNGNTYIELESKIVNQVIRLMKNNTDIAVSDLAEWDILDVYQSADGALIEINVIEKQLEGAIKRINEDEVLIDETVYKLSQSFMDVIAENHPDAARPQAGKTAVFYLNGHSEVVAIDYGNSGEHLYAYMIAAGGEIKNFVSDARVKLFNQKGEMLMLDVAERITLNGKKGVEHSEFLNYLKSTPYSKQCVVKYGVNSLGKLNFLDTPDENVASAESTSENLQFLTTWDGELDWTAGYNLENTRYRLTDKTVIFSMPADLSNDKGYRVIKNSDITVSADHGTPAKFDLYDANEVFRVGAAVYYGGASGLAAKYTNTIIVKEVIKVLDDEGDVRTQVIGLEVVSIRAGEGYTREVTYLEEEPGILDALVPGSVFLYKLNADGEISEIRHDYFPDKNREFFWSNDDSVQVGFYCYGKVEEISYKDKMILVDAGADGKLSIMLRAIATYDEEEGTVVAAPFEEIRIGDVVYLEGSYFHPGITMIHRYKD